ncbi:maternal B9.15 protein [Brachionichthys hirsutus]|uniref:maternal B9.15 protein n=1 Tax=Brachionichthys hirsutus TaxID=412623 RepID=UPI00360506E6
MERELKAGVDFLKRLAVARGKLDEAKAESFAEKLRKLLRDRYDGHWYPDSPSKGQAYRCIQVNNGVLGDEVVLKACEESMLAPSDLGLPPDFTLWIDPLEVCARSGEKSRPFTIARFEEDEEDAAVERDDATVESVNLDTSDYHSASSSDCGSTASSDTEEEAKDEREVAKKAESGGNAYNIVMVPRIRKRQGRAADGAKYGRNLMPAGFQYVYQPAPAWPQYKKGAPVFLSTVCVPPAPAPPLPQQVFGYYILPQPPPQFILPQAALKPWTAVKG